MSIKRIPITNTGTKAKRAAVKPRRTVLVRSWNHEGSHYELRQRPNGKWHLEAWHTSGKYLYSEHLGNSPKAVVLAAKVDPETIPTYDELPA